jgi:hypothetical protein
MRDDALRRKLHAWPTRPACIAVGARSPSPAFRRFGVLVPQPLSIGIYR